MPTSTAHKMGLVTALVLGGLAFSSVSAFAICKYGTPHCINKPGPKAPAVNTNQLPPDSWDNDPDCKAYKKCGYNGTAAASHKGGNHATTGAGTAAANGSHP